MKFIQRRVDHLKKHKVEVSDEGSDDESNEDVPQPPKKNKKSSKHDESSDDESVNTESVNTESSKKGKKKTTSSRKGPPNWLVGQRAPYVKDVILSTAKKTKKRIESDDSNHVEKNAFDGLSNDECCRMIMNTFHCYQRYVPEWLDTLKQKNADPLNICKHPDILKKEGKKPTNANDDCRLFFNDVTKISYFVFGKDIDEIPRHADKNTNLSVNGEDDEDNAIDM